MNRQVGPSIFLSLLIVTFFSFALYQPDTHPGSDRAPRPQSTSRDEGTNKIAATRLQTKLESSSPAEAPFRTVSSRSNAGSIPTSSVQLRKLRTIPRDISRTSGEPLEFPPLKTEEPYPTATRPGRWKKVR